VKDLLELLVRALVDQPEEVEVTEVPESTGTTYEIRVASGDLGKVIGKQGRIADALRTVAKAASMKTRQKVYVQIVSDDERR
jgi:predicted RNA-binding protein YlqC (UPF0109 family)